MFTDPEKEAIRRSWRLVVPIAETAADLFYRRLFELRPEYRVLFPSDISSQKQKLVKMLAFVVKALDWSEDEWEDEVNPSDDLMLVVLALGRRHTLLYRIPDDSYDSVGQALIWTLNYGLGEAFTPQVSAAWLRLYTLLAQTMRMGALSLPNRDESPDVEISEPGGEATLVAQMTAPGVEVTHLGLEES
jgi:hemoglobin-like flavoprotein